MVGLTGDSTASDLDAVEEVKARVIKAHESHDDNQLSLEVGEIVWVIEQDDSGWWGGHKEEDERTAWFPATCVVVVQEQLDIPQMPALDHIKAVAMDSPRQKVALERQALEIDKLKLEVCTLRERGQNALDQLLRTEQTNKELKTELQSCQEDARSDRVRADECEKRLQESRLEVKRLEKSLQREKDDHAQKESDSRVRFQELEVQIRTTENDHRCAQEQLRLAQERNEALLQELQACASTQQPQHLQPRRRLFGSQADSPALSESPAGQIYFAPPGGGTKRPPAQDRSAGQAHVNKQDFPWGRVGTSLSVVDLPAKPELETADQEASVASKIASIEQRAARHSATHRPMRSPSPSRSQWPAIGPNAWNPAERTFASPAPLDVDEDDELQVVLGMSPLNHRGRRASQASSYCPGSSSKQCLDLKDPKQSMVPGGSVKQRIHVFSNPGGS